MLNTVLAFFAAPFLVLLVTSPLVAASVGELHAWGLFFAFGLFFAYASVVMFAVPLYALAARFLGPVKLWHCVAGGFVAAVPLCATEFNPYSSSRPVQASLMYVVVALATGALSGASFWYVRRVLNAEDQKKRSMKSVP